MKISLIIRRWLFVFLVLQVSLLCLATKKINVLILSGSNNHNWQETTPEIKSILEETDLFNVSLTEEPEKMNAEMLSNYQVVLSNWNLFPKTDGNWSEETQKAVLDFVNNGGGFVFVHAGSSTNYDWPEFQQMAGATWGKGTRHGKQHDFEVVVDKFEHPITNGMSNFWTKDELWINMQNFNTCKVIGEALAPKWNKGLDKMEPVLFESKYGKGRTFFLVLGHDVKSMQNIGFRTLLQRGSEWTATGKVTQKIPQELSKAGNEAKKKLKWKKEETSLTLYNNRQLVWQYNFNKAEGKPYFHPLSTVGGTNLTWLRPKDHPWHRAVWFSFKYINGVNYWEEDRKTGISKGATELKTVNYELSKNNEASIKLELSYHPPGESEVLKEQRSVFVSPPNKDGSYYIDWSSEFEAVADEVVLERTPVPGEENGKKFGGYAGISARLNKNLWDAKVFNAKGVSDNLHGTASEYMTFQAKNLKGEDVSMTIFDHPDNPRFPNKWYVENSTKHPFYYYSPAFIFDSKLTLKKGEKLTLKYRLLVSPEGYNQEKLTAVWKNYKSAKK
ncbi:DUF6807 family protein [Labilibacter marinus]|uniref:DUF6807 family protein n=1 Tax=Labilibacter marinus TaxID=1477105 RepID=UPI00094FA432|nr:DUF6807 family protein [Labilibacter marinus]